jgi:hypothetical protein
MTTPSGQRLQNLKIGIDQIPALSGSGIGFIGDGACAVLRPPKHSSGLDTWVLLEERELEDGEGLPSPAEIKEPNLAVELVGLGLNCTGAVFSWAAMGGEALAAPLSGGASLGLLLITWSAALATSLQCGTSIVRSADVALNRSHWTLWLDSQEFYSWASYGLDAMSLAGVAASTSAALRAVRAIRNATGRSSTQILKQLSRAERKRLAEELIRLKYPGVSNSGMKELIRLGQFPARLQTTEVSERLFTQLKDAISAALAFGSSATSGALRYLYVNVVQE